VSIEEYPPCTASRRDQTDDEGVSPQFPAIALDPTDRLHVVFTQYQDKLVYGTKRTTESSWTFSDVNNDNTPAPLRFRIMGNSIDLCSDASGGVHVLAHAEGRDAQDESFDVSAVYFYKPAGGDWRNEILLQGEVNTRHAYGIDPSITTAGDHIYATFGGYSTITFAQKPIGRGAWEIEHLFETDFLNGGKYETSLCTDPAGSPVFAYYDYYGEEGYAFHGLKVAMRRPCDGSWRIDQALPDNVYLRHPAISVDDDGMIFLAVGGNDFRLFRRACDCQQSWRQLYHDPRINSDFTDLVIDPRNQVHVLCAYQTSVTHLKAWCDGNPDKTCNRWPAMSFEGRTNVKPGEEWSATIRARDPECDPIEIFSIILPDGFSVTDHGNGSATARGKIDPGPVEGIRTVGFSVFCNDDQHPPETGRHAGMSITLRISEEGLEEGEIRTTDNCWGRE